MALLPIFVLALLPLLALILSIMAMGWMRKWVAKLGDWTLVIIAVICVLSGVVGWWLGQSWVAPELAYMWWYLGGIWALSALIIGVVLGHLPEYTYRQLSDD